MLIVASFLAIVCVLSLLASLGYSVYALFKGKVLHACIGLIVIAFFLYWSIINLAWVSVILGWGN